MIQLSAGQQRILRKKLSVLSTKILKDHTLFDFTFDSIVPVIFVINEIEQEAHSSNRLVRRYHMSSTIDNCQSQIVASLDIANCVSTFLPYYLVFLLPLWYARPFETVDHGHRCWDIDYQIVLSNVNHDFDSR